MLHKRSDRHRKFPLNSRPGTICHIVLPVTAVNIRMICDTRVQQRNKHWPIMWIMFISQANQRGNDPDLELRGQGRPGQPRPDDHHQWELRVRRPRSISHQHEVSAASKKEEKKLIFPLFSVPNSLSLGPFSISVAFSQFISECCNF